MNHRELRMTAGGPIFALFVLAALGTTMLTAQVDPRRPDRGFKGANSYSISDIENVNLTNGNLMLNIPLGSLPAGRDSAPGYTVSLNYNSKLWNAKREYRTDGLGQGIEGLHYSRELIEAADNGGWHLDTGYYKFNLVYRLEQEAPCTLAVGEEGYRKNAYTYKVEMQVPNGSIVGFGPNFDPNYYDGFADTDPWGREYSRSWTRVDPQIGDPYATCGENVSSPSSTGTNYYTQDGSHLRLHIPAQSTSLHWSELRWTLYFPDGKTVEHLPTDDSSIIQRTTDRNGNHLIKTAATVNGVSGSKIMDDFGRYVFVGYTSGGDVKVIQPGVGGEFLETTIEWTDPYVYHNYRATYANNANTSFLYADLSYQISGVSALTLPEQSGGLQYTFTYHASDTQPSSYTEGWGQLKSVTLPSGAEAEYTYGLTGNTTGIDSTVLTSDKVLSRTLTYSTEYDGQTQEVTETTSYDSGSGGGNTCTPDGQCTSEISAVGGDLNGYAYRIAKTGGFVTEKIWVNRRSVSGGTYLIDPIVKTEFTSVPNPSGTPTITATKAFEYDQNGNVLEVREYDWVDYSSVPRSTEGAVNEYLPVARPTGTPSNLTLKRKTVNTYYNPTPNTLDAGTPHANWSGNPSAPKFLNLIKSTEVRDSSDTVKSRTEFFYDSLTAGGNLTEVRAWDSTKGSLATPDSNGSRLNSGNSISTFSEYDQYGNVTETTDAHGVQTTITYGCIDGSTSSPCPSGAPNNLYSTKTEVASNYSSLKRTSSAKYDFYTGVVTEAKDVDNDVIVKTIYDDLGRPTIVKSAYGTALEAWTQTEYHDEDRFVVVMSDLEAKEDAKKVAIQHFDQLGRLRLSRTLENAATDDPEDEADGIKVQTRYKFTSGYTWQLTSNPYRAATSSAETDATMGWTRSKGWSTGIQSEVETFSGATLPYPFLTSGYNTSSTGVVNTSRDANATTVTDQASKVRRTITNGLGWLVRVDEPTSSGLGTVSSPNQPTDYTYDVLNNLLTVTQASSTTAQCGGASSCSQTRTFTYSSLSRLLTANNPESGTISYEYDNNGNLTEKTDARSIVTTYTYDALNRVTDRDYTNEPSASETADVNYHYGTTAPAIGKLTKVENGVSTTEYTSFDILGRVTGHKQTTAGGDSNGYATAYVYNLAGALIEETYPSTRKVKNVLDSGGDLAVVQSKKNSSSGFWHYADAFSYNAVGAVTSMQLGNGRWESMTFNSRLQPTQIALGTTQGATNLLDLDYEYGTTASVNNGNVTKQTINVPTVGSNVGFAAVQTYTYDELNRLKSATENLTPAGGSQVQTWKQTYTFDRYGNRRFDFTSGNTTVPASSCTEAVCNPTSDPSNNQLNSAGYDYDASGNTTYDAALRKFTYDAENKQTKAESTNTELEVQATLGEYFYDGDGKRAKKIVNDEVTIFVYDAAGKLVAEYATTIASQQDAKVAYLTNDHLGSPRINTDRDGTVTARHDYHPFGEEIATSQRTSGLGYPTSGDGIRKQFTGQDRDNETALDYFGARYLSQLHGRFNSPDPFSFQKEMFSDPQRFNLYGYVRNNPLYYVDPTGMIIDVSRMSEDERKKWEKVLAVINAKDEQGNYVNKKLREVYERLDSDKRTFFIQNHSFGDRSGTTGQFNITKHDGKDDFSEAVLKLDFEKIEHLKDPVDADMVPRFKKFDGLFGQTPELRAELFGHEGSHAVWALDNIVDAVSLQVLIDARDAALKTVKKYPYPPDVMKKMEEVDRRLVPTERFAQQNEQIINGELRNYLKKK